MAADGYIFVIQNLRGRFKSEGTFTLSEDALIGHGKGTIETRDAWDTIDWLVKNVPHNNGRVGIMGVSYSGYTAAATLLDPHPALKAVSEQAAGPVDEWMHDDDHRYGALRLSYDFEYAVMEESDKLANSNFAFDQWDTYQWYLYLASSVQRQRPLRTWQGSELERYRRAFQTMTLIGSRWSGSTHCTARRFRISMSRASGTRKTHGDRGKYSAMRPKTIPIDTNLIVAGPWCHGCWLAPAEDKLGPWPLGHETAREFREAILAPFFAYWLHGKGTKPDFRAKIFQTGSNTWRTYPGVAPEKHDPDRAVPARRRHPEL